MTSLFCRQKKTFSGKKAEFILGNIEERTVKGLGFGCMRLPIRRLLEETAFIFEKA